MNVKSIIIRDYGKSHKWTFGENKPNQSQFFYPQRGRKEDRIQKAEDTGSWFYTVLANSAVNEYGKQKMETKFICTSGLLMVKYDFQMAKPQPNFVDIDKWLK